jgi:hypothetical protein
MATTETAITATGLEPADPPACGSVWIGEATEAGAGASSELTAT